MATLGNNIANAVKSSVNASLGSGIPVSTPAPDGGLSSLFVTPMDMVNFIGSLGGITIGNYPSFNQKMYGCMLYLMKMNIEKKNITLNMLGNDAYLVGDSNAMPGNLLRPSYAEGMNYINFVSDVNANEKRGIDATRTTDINKGETVNLYPDDLGSGTKDFTNKWNLSGDRNSILDKTKRLFNERKINTLISRFATGADDGGNSITYNGQVGSEFGESHGRNLLKKGAKLGENYQVNGYNNPYCRVWTHHYQYDELSKTMRPFDNGNNSLWKNFNLIDDKKWGWKSSKQTGWEHSVLNKKTGFLNITPVYDGGGKKNIHTKQCMFSIENLAWKGYDPYSFEKALSWEQRGPLGGRIMWFPPYGISFSETSSVDWQKETFIGRGEDVFTYKNTRRTGTLRFMLIVDHPSIIDYSSWYDINKNSYSSNSGDHKFANFSESGLENDDYHRFFAGCDVPENGDSSNGTIMNAAKPTPLTDEGIQLKSDGNPEAPETKKPKEAPLQPDDNEEIKINFFAFYPNNYSGMYDLPSSDSIITITDGISSSIPSPVNSIAYLLRGIGAGMTTTLDSDKRLTRTDYPMLFSDNNLATGNFGYEMNNANGISTSASSYIIGNQVSWQKVEKDNDKLYDPDINKKWYYRIDGEYEYPQNEVEGYKNTFGQILLTNPDYKDTKSFGLNKSIEHITDNAKFCSDTTDVYSLAEIVCALMHEDYMEDYSTEWLKYIEDSIGYDGSNDVSERVDAISKVFQNYKLTELRCVGFSNSQGEISPVVKDRNRVLADGRCSTIVDFIKTTSLYDESVKISKSAQHSVDNDVPKTDVNDINAKLWRSAKCTLVFKASDTVNVEDTAQTPDGSDRTVHYNQVGTENGVKIFEDEQGKKWVYVNGEYVDHETYKKNKGDNSGNVITKILDQFDANDDSTINKLRYDQEYHFFKALEKTDPIGYQNIMEKIKYFDPAFHSMTPEGFNARLTFLHQCTRQGDTTTVSDGKNGQSANNLAFGRPPFCVLRLGDFFNQLIVIESVNIEYLDSSGVQWDLNNEGAGVQPMLANVSLQISFIGGADMAGPIRRLQNAMSFNYYANASLYDNRADRAAYNESDWHKMGGGGNHKPDYGNTYTHVVDTYHGDPEN